MNSAVYEGFVAHRRLEPVEHSFRHRHCMLYLDLDELPAAFDAHPLFSARGPALAWFRRADYHGDPERPLADCVRDLVAARIGRRPQGPVRLLSTVRSFGHCFNPVSFYYCGDPTEAVVAEVTNTPWGERHAYVMDCAGQGRFMEHSFEKAFHVSPFMGMDHVYEWRLSAPGECLSVHIDSHREGRKTFDATLSLERRELSRGALTRVLLRYPATTLRVSALIYAHGLALKLKGAPHFPHPEPPRVST